MQHFSNPVITTDERIIISAVLSFEEERVFYYYFLPYIGMTPFEQFWVLKKNVFLLLCFIIYMYGQDSHLNKISVPFKQ